MAKEPKTLEAGAEGSEETVQDYTPDAEQMKQRNIERAKRIKEADEAPKPAPEPDQVPVRGPMRGFEKHADERGQKEQDKHARKEAKETEVGHELKRADPPFDGKPCPLCPVGVRDICAVGHNFLTATVMYPLEHMSEPRARRKLHSLIMSVTDKPRETMGDNVHVLAWYDKCKQIADAAETGANWGRVLELARELLLLHPAIEELSNAHFADRAHWSDRPVDLK